MKKILALLLVVAWNLFESANAQIPPGVRFEAPGPNVALHKPYVLAPDPNYRHCGKDPDHTVLTDGRYTKGHFWTQQTTVGWANRALIEITVDLGRVEPIAGASYNTAAGAADVNWPRAVLIFTSDDNVTYRPAGDLVRGSVRSGLPAPQVYAVHRYASDRIKTRGRYVKFVVDSLPEYCFCDEVEVYRGPDDLLQAPVAEAIKDIKSLVVRNRLDACIVHRLYVDLAAVQAAVEGSSLSLERKAAAREDLKKLRTEIENLPPTEPEGFRAMLPLNDVDRQLFAWRGEALHAAGGPELVVWKRNRWDPLGPMDIPETPGKTPPGLDIRVMLNEYRSDAFNLTNASDRPLHVALTVEGLPGGPDSSLLTVHRAPIVATSFGDAVSDALPQIERTETGYAFDLAAGMNTQVWIMAHTSNIAPGSYSGKVRVAADRGEAQELPLNLKVYPLQFPARPRLSLSGCEYSDSNLGYSITSSNLKSLLHFLQKYYVDSPWAHSGVLSLPKADDFDEADQLRHGMRFDALDEWIKRWPLARQFFVYLAREPGSGFAGAAMGTPKFEHRVAAWTRAFAEHVRSLGLKPSQFYFLIVDEPTEPRQCETISAWAKAMRSLEDRPTVWVTFYACPMANYFQSMFSLCDMLCPHIPGFVEWDQEGQASALKNIAGERFLWLYSAIGPSRTMDPYTYYRLLPWLCYRHNARGCIFWAFSDAGHAPTSWDDFLAAGKQYCPQYIEPDRMTDSKQMQGIVEGVQDHEYLCLLCDRVKDLEQKGVKSEALAAARRLAERAVHDVTDGIRINAFRWEAPKDRSVADRFRIEILETLSLLQNHPQ